MLRATSVSIPWDVVLLLPLLLLLHWGLILAGAAGAVFFGCRHFRANPLQYARLVWVDRYSAFPQERTGECRPVIDQLGWVLDWPVFTASASPDFDRRTVVKLAFSLGLPSFQRSRF